jgi:predicted transcriptional regulator
MSKNYKKWTAEEELVISRMRKEGKTIKEIAKSLNRTESSVTFRIHQMINCCTLQKKGKSSVKTHKNYTHAFGFSTKPEIYPTGKKVSSKSKIDYDEVARRIENGGLRNIQKTLREYSKETGISIYALHRAYYSESQPRTRIKDRVRAYTIVTPKGVIHGANKNTDKPIIKVSIWSKMKTWLSSLLLS